MDSGTNSQSSYGRLLDKGHLEFINHNRGQHAFIVVDSSGQEWNVIHYLENHTYFFFFFFDNATLWSQMWTSHRRKKCESCICKFNVDPWSMIDTEACGAGSRRDFDLVYLSRVTDTRGEFYISRIYGPWVIYTIFCAEKVHVEENCFRRLRHASQYFTVTIGGHAVQISVLY